MKCTQPGELGTVNDSSPDTQVCEPAQALAEAHNIMSQMRLQYTLRVVQFETRVGPRSYSFFHEATSRN
jgi:hypothetical protein